MSTDIAVIAPDADMHDLFVRLREETGHEFLVESGLLEEGLEAGKRLAAQGCKVLISRGETTVKLREADLHVFILDLPISEHDIVPLIVKARDVCSHIAIAGFGAIVRVARDVAPLLSVKVDIYSLSSVRDIPGVVRQISDSGVPVVIGTPGVVTACKEAGLQGFYLRTRKETAQVILAQAVKLADLIRRESEWRLRHEAYHKITSGTFFTLDANGNPVSVDPAESAKPLPAPLKQKLLYALRQGVACNCRVTEKSGLEHLYRLQPVIHGGTVLGTVVFLDRTGPVRARQPSGFEAKHDFEDIVHASPSMHACLALARRYAASQAPILISGPSGTGKEVFAHAIHNGGRRAGGPLVAVNCGAFPESLLESELFGYAEGAFTGARRNGKPGMFELADGGTIFLDEISEMPLPLQVKLLRLLEDRRVLRLGGDRYVDLDVRVICATNRDLEAAVNQGRFREDLYFRINVLPLSLPALSQRRECIPDLVQRLLSDICQRQGLARPVLRPSAVRFLQNLEYPGNVRELRNILERVAVLHGGSTVTGDVLRAIPGLSARPVNATRSGSSLHQEGLRLIRQVLAECGDNKTLAARRLGISKTTLWRRLRRDADRAVGR